MTAPLGESAVLVSASLGILGMLLSPKHPLYPILSIIYCVTGGSLAHGQFKLRGRLERSIQENGFDIREFYPTVHHWCDIQTAKVVARKYGHLGDYLNLLHQRKSEKAT